MNQQVRCETCSGPLSAAGALSGRCPRCLLLAALDSEDSGESLDGMTFGPYEVIESIGAGGMGEVYKARDTRLQRDVAIKVLRTFDTNSSSWERFQRESRAASALSHPNICTVHDVGEVNGQPYLVMELLEGVTLRAHLGEKALETTAVLAISAQITSALEAAHSKGIVHRDIKPANVMITGSGYIKVLDFSLARQTGSDAGETRIGETLTLESLTADGTVAGTPHYLSPEALQGARADVRSDLWAFGVVLYQMLSGRLPFTGATMMELSESILKNPAPPLPSSVPSALRAIVDRCLRKRPEERYQNAGEVRLALETAPAGSITRRKWLWAAGVVAALAGGGFVWQQRRNGSSNLLDVASWKTTQLTNFTGDELDGVISPDGKWVAFISDVEGTFDIWTHEVGTGNQSLWSKGGVSEGSRNLIRDMGFTADGEIWTRPYTPASTTSGDARVTPRSRETPTRPFPEPDASELAWSVDGTQMAYIVPKDADSIFVADRTGANPKKLLGNDDRRIHQHSLVWSRDGAWLYFTRGLLGPPNRFDIWRIPSRGGAAVPLTDQNTELGYPTPIDDRTVLYLAKDEQGLGPWLWALDAETKKTRRVNSGTDVYISLSGMANPNGRKLVATIAKPSPGLWSVPIPEQGHLAQDANAYPIPKAQLPWAPRFGADKTDGGSLYFLSSPGSTGDGLWRYRHSGLTNVWKGSDGALFEPPVVSRDGEQIAIKLRRNGRPVWHISLADGSNRQPVGEHLDIEGSATFAPDGKSLLTGATDALGPGLFQIPVDGSTPSRLISANAQNPIWSAEANLIVYTEPAVRNRRTLHAIRPNGAALEIPMIQVNGPQAGRFLPDGTGMVYRLAANFSHLDLATLEIRQLTDFKTPAAIESFDITPDGKQIVFDRHPRNSDIHLIELPSKA